MTSVRHVLASRARLAERPVWDPGRQKLAWVDIYNHRVHQFDPAWGSDRHFDTGDLVAAVALTTGDRLLVALRDRIAFLHLDDGRLETRTRAEFPDADTRFNDGKCDALGRFWVGTISQKPGHAALYRHDPDGWRASMAPRSTGVWRLR